MMITDTEIKIIGVKALTDALGEINAEVKFNIES